MSTAGTLYVVATPIGNLEDMTLRAIRTLKEVDVIAAEDTRHSRKLLDKFAIQTPMVPFHQHNETRQTARLIRLLARGDSIALISDAGTPLISDPGMTLVNSARESGITVVPIPGASALASALSVFGLPVENTIFVGFLPAKKSDRIARLTELSAHVGTVVFYEAPHRIVKSLQDIRSVFGDECRAGIAREMTKIHESVQTGALADLADWVLASPNNQKGEMVVAVQSPGRQASDDQADMDRVLRILMEELSASKSAEVASRMTDTSRNVLYRRALQIKKASNTTDSN